ncbi:MAG: mandelate racemase/muconate lactonizing enzyme family protein [Deltaproteobacteria bacterium]|jgi:L-alanine-DL-glutamate epimerase-like enolase superfamily enzyme|nr:mandelate racemase/muconate lactonizing enzyme family protein [Deltaproteobacteria bacterium]MBW2530201.1 mandelate racemase/muconate lactonizing enzyme family protein [Deltaproteobacteria bacterium]
MKITRIDLWHVAAELPAPFSPAWIPGMRQQENRFDLIRLTTASGLQGWSAAPAMGSEREGFGALLGPYFLGERADDIANVRQRIREMGYLGHRCGWIEPACWDIIGKSRQLPVYRLLGGRGGSVRLYASTGELCSGPARIDEVQARLSEGFAGVKLRVHDATLQQDVAQLREVRRAVGDDVTLGVDANQAWRVAVVADAPRWTYPRALDLCREAEQLGFAWVEEPLPMDDYEGLARLTAATSVPIAGGELNNQGLPEFGTMLFHRCYDWYQPDAVFTGGIAETWSIIRRVQAAGATYTPHTWTNGIGFAINLQLFAASEGRDDKLLEYPLSPPGWIPEARDALLTEPWLHHRGTLRLPEAPGLGFEIDPRALRRYGHRFLTATKLRVAVRALLDRGPAEAKRLGAVRNERLSRRNEELNRSIAAGGDPPLDAVRDLTAEPANAT